MAEITRRRDAIEAKRLGQLRGPPLKLAPKLNGYYYAS